MQRTVSIGWQWFINFDLFDDRFNRDNDKRPCPSAVTGPGPGGGGGGGVHATTRALHQAEVSLSFIDPLCGLDSPIT